MEFIGSFTNITISMSLSVYSISIHFRGKHICMSATFYSAIEKLLITFSFIYFLPFLVLSRPIRTLLLDFRMMPLVPSTPDRHSSSYVLRTQSGPCWAIAVFHRLYRPYSYWTLPYSSCYLWTFIFKHIKQNNRR